MNTKKSPQREVYIPGDPVIEAYRAKLLKAWNSPEDIESLFAQREAYTASLWNHIPQDDTLKKIDKILWL